MSSHPEFDPSRRNLLLAGAAAGGALSSFASLAGAAPAAESSSAPIFYTRNEGIQPDDRGAAAALAELLARAPSGAVIVFHPGRYKLKRWKGFQLSKSITLLAHPRTVTLIGPGTSRGFEKSFVTIGNTSVKGPVRVAIEGLSFEQWGDTIAARLSSPIESLEVRRCAFDTVHSGVEANRSEGQAYGRIDHVAIEDCEVRNSAGSALSVRALFRSAFVLRNRISDGRRSGIVLGSTMPPNGVHEDQWKKAIVSQNICTNLLNPKEGADIHGIIVAGRDIIITENHIEKVENGGGTGAEGIYAKARYADISHNTLVDAGFKEAAITLKGRPRTEKKRTTPGGFANRICNNSIVSRRPKPYGRGIVTFHGDMLIANNYCENLRVGIRTISRRGDDGVLISANLVRGIDRTGISHTGTGSKLSVIGNSISLVDFATQDGVMLNPTPKKGEYPKDWVVKDNSIECQPGGDALKRGISIYCGESGRAPLEGMVISNNHLANLSVGIWAKGGHSPIFPRNGAWIHGNYFRACKRDVAPVLANDRSNVIIENNLSR